MGTLSTYELHAPIPRRRDKGILLDVGPVDREDFSSVLLPCTDRMVLGMSEGGKYNNLCAYIEHNVPKTY